MILTKKRLAVGRPVEALPVIRFPAIPVVEKSLGQLCDLEIVGATAILSGTKPQNNAAEEEEKSHLPSHSSSVCIKLPETKRRRFEEAWTMQNGSLSHPPQQNIVLQTIVRRHGSFHPSLWSCLSRASQAR